MQPIRRYEVEKENKQNSLCDPWCIEYTVFLLLRLYPVRRYFPASEERQKAKIEQILFNQEMKITPLFGQWFRSEDDLLKNKQRSSVIVVGILSVLLFISLIGMLILLMDGGGKFKAAVCLLLLLIIYFSWWLTDYRKQFIRPLLNSVSKQLLTSADKESFARQFLESGVDESWKNELKVTWPPFIE